MGEKKEEYLFVGERRSPTAQKNGWTWDNCANGKPRLCSIQLFEALEMCGIIPKLQEFVNVWQDDGSYTPNIFSMLAETDRAIVAMGRTVQAELKKRGIPHLFIYHPAARGWIRGKGRYAKHVRETLL
jgi:hypothetical protein